MHGLPVGVSPRSHGHSSHHHSATGGPWAHTVPTAACTRLLSAPPLADRLPDKVMGAVLPWGLMREGCVLDMRGGHYAETLMLGSVGATARGPSLQLPQQRCRPAGREVQPAL